MLKNLKSEIDSKDSAFKDIIKELQRVSEDNSRLDQRIREFTKKEMDAIEKLRKKEEEF